MTGTAWVVLWATLLVGSLLTWIVLLRRTYLSFRRLEGEVRRLVEAISSVKTIKQTRLSQSPQASNEEER